MRNKQGMHRAILLLIKFSFSQVIANEPAERRREAGEAAAL